MERGLDNLSTTISHIYKRAWNREWLEFEQRLKIILEMDGYSPIKNIWADIWKVWSWCFKHLDEKCVSRKKKQQTVWLSNKTKMYVLTTSIQHCTGSSTQGIQARKSDKRHPDWKVWAVVTCKTSNTKFMIFSSIPTNCLTLQTQIGCSIVQFNSDTD